MQAEEFDYFITSGILWFLIKIVTRFSKIINWVIWEAYGKSNLSHLPDHKQIITVSSFAKCVRDDVDRICEFGVFCWCVIAAMESVAWNARVGITTTATRRSVCTDLPATNRWEVRWPSQNRVKDLMCVARCKYLVAVYLLDRALNRKSSRVNMMYDCVYQYPI